MENGRVVVFWCMFFAWKRKGGNQSLTIKEIVAKWSLILIIPLKMPDVLYSITVILVVRLT
jgi:hypothetical protein